MTVADVFAISGLGTVAAGHIESGTIKFGDTVWLHNSKETVKTGIAFIQVGPQHVKTAGVGDAVGLVLRGLSLDQVQIGNVLSASAS
jgi:translation elongation factor EF-Tu-like GTPase